MTLELVELETAALSWPDQANALRICNQESYERASEMLLGIKALRKEIDGVHDPSISAAHASHVAALAAKKKSSGPLDQAEQILKRGLGAFLQAQEQLRVEAERKARAEAARLEEELRLEQAQIAQDMGASAEAVEEIVSTPLAMPEPVVPRTFAPVAGVSAREVWKWVVVDQKAIPNEYLGPDAVKIGGIVRALKGQTKISGIKVYSETGIAARTR